MPDYLLIIYVVVWAILIIPTARWAQRHVRTDRKYEGDNLDPISSTEAGIYGLLWPTLWPAALVGLIIYAAAWLVGLLIDSQMRV